MTAFVILGIAGFAGGIFGSLAWALRPRLSPWDRKHRAQVRARVREFVEGCE